MTKKSTLRTLAALGDELSELVYEIEDAIPRATRDDRDDVDEILLYVQSIANSCYFVSRHPHRASMDLSAYIADADQAIEGVRYTFRGVLA